MNEREEIDRKLQDAVFDGDVEAARYWLEQGADPDCQPYDETYFNGPEPPPLHWAVLNRSEDMVQLLIDHGADVNRAYDGEVPLLEALHEYAPAIALLLIEAGADLTVRDAAGRTPLGLARRESVFYEVLEAIKCRL
jgi:ankyrin repeat protein